MKFLDFLTNYSTRILLFAILILIICISVFNYSKNYEEAIENIKDIEEVSNLKCKIVSFPLKNNENFEFTAKVISSKEASLIGLRVNVTLKNGNYSFLPGDVVIISGNLYHPKSKSNEGGFDSENYNKSENIHAKIYCTKKAKLESYGTNAFIRTVARARNGFAEYTDKYFMPRYAGIVKALTTGEKAFIYESDADNLKNSGVYHIVAISGLHLNIFIIACAYMISKVKLKGFKKALLSAFVNSMVALLVLIFTGFGLSVIRAFAMLIISLGSGIFSRRYQGKYALSISCAFTLIILPCSIYSVGYQLSVLSTYAVLISASIIKRLKEYSVFKKLSSLSVVSVIITSFMCSAFTLIPMVKSFGFLPVYSFLGNMLILPFVTPALSGSVLFGIVSALGLDIMAFAISNTVSALLLFIVSIAKMISHLPFSTIKLYPLFTMYIFSSIIILSGGIYLLHKNKTKSAICLCLIFALATGSVLLYNNKDEAKVIFADVGQGDCTIITLPQNEAVMVDFGTDFLDDYKLSEIKQTLVKLNIRKLSAIFVSHFHTDHISGVIELANEGLVNTLILPKYYDIRDKESCENYKELLSASLKKPVKIKYVSEGSSVKIGKDAVFDVVLPSKDMFLEANDMSTVVKLSYGRVSFLFTGDISEDGTRYLLDKDINCDVLKVPHHGGKNRYIKNILENSSPEYAVISCGENNTYNHPHPGIVSALESYKTKIYRTDKMGAVSFEIDRTKIKSVSKMR